MTRAGEAVILSKYATDEPSTASAQAPGYLSQKIKELRESAVESDNAAILLCRHVSGKVARWFDENETAKVIKRMKALDPDFTMERMTVELREYIIPEVLDALLHGDKDSLKMWCSEGVSATFLRKCIFDC